MDERSVDVAVIGAGSAGLNAVSELDKAGVDWVLIEGAQYGTTCARVGCMPSKLLIAAANAAHGVRQASTFGINVVDLSIDEGAVLGRVRSERDRFVDSVVENTRDWPAERRMMGCARFTGPDTLAIDNDAQVTAKSIVIAVGSTPRIPAPLRDLGADLLTTDDVFELSRLPRSLAVVGAGAIGLELGQAFGRLGVDVTLFTHGDTVGAFTDPQLQDYALCRLMSELKFELNADLQSAVRGDDGVRLAWRDGEDKPRHATFERVLVAAGRESNIGKLNLEATGLELNDRGMPQWDARTTQCGDLPIFLAGDANQHKTLLHEAADEGRVAGHNAANYPEIVAHARRTPLRIVFTEPQMAVVGASYEELDRQHVDIAAASFEDQGRARVIDKHCGLMRLYADRRSCLLVGAELYGPHVEHIAHLVAWAIESRLTVPRLLQMPFYHPVLEEGLRTGLRELSKTLKVAGDGRRADMADSPGM